MREAKPALHTTPTPSGIWGLGGKRLFNTKTSTKYTAFCSKKLPEHVLSYAGIPWHLAPTPRRPLPHHLHRDDLHELLPLQLLRECRNRVALVPVAVARVAGPEVRLESPPMVLTKRQLVGGRTKARARYQAVLN